MTSNVSLVVPILHCTDPDQTLSLFVQASVVRSYMQYNDHVVCGNRLPGSPLVNNDAFGARSRKSCLDEYLLSVL